MTYWKNWKKKYRERLLKYGIPTDVVSIEDRRRIFEYIQGMECTFDSITWAISDMGLNMNNNITLNDFAKAKAALEAANVPTVTCWGIQPNTFSFGDCKPCIPQVCDTPIPFGIRYSDPYDVGQYKEQGNNPMRIETNSATAVVSAIQSDESIQRDFLLCELAKSTESWRDPKPGQFRKLFNLDAPKFPATSQELIDAFSKGEFTVDQAKVDLNTAYQAGKLIHSYDEDDQYVGERFYGITFTSLPVADFDGYHAALKVYEKLKIDTKRKIIVGSPADGLAAIEALEAWMPTQNAPTTATVQ